ncbi:WD40-repeat-containing domain protein [Achaetomium macrosporum]|uniref:WD40-repeat-containing domain protein n=1 Tax=Achaetomium macrosporum TaxID=79813 RepID=A0AAN7HG06_9PEZI|nr:WD40-repeat-containing domain protein [Achaetomium macrosporum]
MAYGAGKPLGSSASNGLLDKDVEFPKGPEDTISALRWSPVSNHLAASSWDGKVYIYDASNSTSTTSIRGVAAITVGAPVLGCDFSKDGTIAAGAAADKTIQLMDLNSSQTMKLEGHAAPVRAVRFVEVPSANAPIIASGSWDKTVRYWDLRQPQPIGKIQLSERVYAMDAAGPLLFAATADNQLHLVDLRANPLQLWRSTKSPLAHQTTTASVSSDGSRWAIGSIEGRTAAQAADEKDKSFENLSFKCHRESSPAKKNQTDVYAVNAVCYSPAHKDLLATGGSDSTYHIWDVQTHRRLRAFPKVSGPVTALSFRRDGMALAYAVGYDWSKGYMHNKPETEKKIVLHVFGEVLKK